MKSLVHFLQARIQEDEAAAHIGWAGGWPSHRVLAECAAKREVLAVLARDVKANADADAWDWLDEQSAISWLFGDSNEDKAKKLATEVLRALAKPYDDHPDYQPDWTVRPKRSRKFW